MSFRRAVVNSRPVLIPGSTTKKPSMLNCSSGMLRGENPDQIVVIEAKYDLDTGKVVSIHPLVSKCWFRTSRTPIPR